MAKIEIDLAEINSKDIIEEIYDRIRHKVEGQTFAKELSKYIEMPSILNYNSSIKDFEKQEFLDSHFHEITLKQLESLICK